MIDFVCSLETLNINVHVCMHARIANSTFPSRHCHRNWRMTKKLKIDCIYYARFASDFITHSQLKAQKYIVEQNKRRLTDDDSWNGIRKEVDGFDTFAHTLFKIKAENTQIPQWHSRRTHFYKWLKILDIVLRGKRRKRATETEMNHKELFDRALYLSIACRICYANDSPQWIHYLNNINCVAFAWLRLNKYAVQSIRLWIQTDRHWHTRPYATRR